MSSRANSCAFAVKSASVFSANENLLFFFPSCFFANFFDQSISPFGEENLSSFFL